MLSQWLQMEYYRLDCVETWEDGPRKQATRAAILNAIASLTGNGQGRPAYGCRLGSPLPLDRLTHSRPGSLQFPAGFSICSTA
jgi:hypothetical protein